MATAPRPPSLHGSTVRPARATTMVVLALLAQGPNTGYGLALLMQGTLRHVWRARLQQVYFDLARLARAGLVSVRAVPISNRPSKKEYSLTEKGRAALGDWLLRRPSRPLLRDELLVMLYVSASEQREIACNLVVTNV